MPGAGSRDDWACARYSGTQCYWRRLCEPGEMGANLLQLVAGAGGAAGGLAEAQLVENIVGLYE